MISNIKIIIFFLIFLLATSAAAASIDFNKILGALSSNIGPVIRLTQAIAYVIGIWFMVSAIKDLKAIGQSQSQGAGGLGGPLTRLVLGVALVYLPSTIDMAVSTLWGSGATILSYTPTNASDSFAQAKKGAVMLIQAVGWISFVKGFVILNHSTQQGAQQGTVGKGIIHIAGGILAINIVATIKIIGNSIGITII